MSISEAHAVRIARDLAMARGWTWKEPVSVTRVRRFWLLGAPLYRVVTNTEAIGLNIRVTIDALDGRVLHAGYNPR